MAGTFKAQGLAHWVALLVDQKLPVLPASALQVSRLLKDPEVALNDLGNVIASDPVMRVHLVRESNRQFGERAASVLTNPHHCLSMLGLDRVNLLLRQFKSIRGDGSDPRDIPYLQAISNSLHAAAQATSWTRFRNLGGSDFLHMGALLYGVPTWCLWRYALKEMQIIDTLYRREQVPLREAEQAVLGCTREQIALELAQRWHMPPSVCEVLATSQLPSTKFMLRAAQRKRQDPDWEIPNRTASGTLVNSPGLALALSYLLTQEATRDWYSPQTRRCETMIAVYLGQTEVEISRHCHQIAVQCATEWHPPGTLAPAANLIWPLQSRQPRRLKPALLPAAIARLYAGKTSSGVTPSVVAKPTPKPAQAPVKPQPQRPKHIGIRSEHLPEDLDRQAILGAPAPTPRQDASSAPSAFLSQQHKQAFESLLQALVQQPDFFSDEYEALRAVADTLIDNTRLERALIIQFQPQQNEISTYYARGCEQTPLLRKYSIRLQHKNLFSQLLKQPAATWISPDQPNQVSGLIPGTFKQACQSQHGFLMSVFGPRGAFGLLYADKGHQRDPSLSEQEYKLFKIAGNSCSKHLQARSKPATTKKTGQ